ncbi:MAG TPA: sensor histidine kinase [Dongiaceae bacterium]|nr:sensor histidine kinase [Dongiaceae bacterium]
MTGGGAKATVLWSHPEPVVVRDNGKGEDILHGAIKPRDANSSGTLYFRMKVDPIADTATKVISKFEAGFMLVEKGQEHLGMGDSWEAMAYSALNVPKAPKGFQDLNSRLPEPPYPYEYMRAGTPRYLVWKVEYVPNQDARVTAWLDPDLSIGATEFSQATDIVVRFEANANFDEFHLVHRGSGNGWKFSQMVVGTSFEDLLVRHFWQEWWFFAGCVWGMLVLVAGTVQLFERRRARAQIQRLERERALATERARIAQDIHDEVGVNLTKISKLSEAMGREAERESQDAEARRTIVATAHDTIRAMDEIVWAINPHNDTLKEMADYLVYFAKDFLQATGIGCKLEVPLDLPDIPVATEVRHSTFMAVKEALNNAVRHARPAEIRLALAVIENEITITIADDGSGFCLDRASGVGNGLENMQKRMHDIGGRVEFITQAGSGATVTFHVPLTMTVALP